METNIQKWGNSLGLRIPIHLAKQLDLQAGCVVNIKIVNSKIIIEPRKYDLNTLLDGITKQNLHSLELDDKQQLGGEEW